jgi:hypothetical protein
VVDEEDIQRVDGPSEQYGGSWDNQRVGGTVLGDAEPVREVAGRYRETGDAGVVMDTREAEGTHCGKKIWARRRPVVHWCGGASVLTRSHGAEEEASGTASYLQADQRVVRV